MTYKIQDYDLKELKYTLQNAQKDIQVEHNLKENKLGRDCWGCYSCQTSLPSIMRALQIIQKITGV